MPMQATVRNNIFGSLAADLPANAKRARNASARRVAKDWKKHVHVDTGAYRDSIDAADGTAYATVKHAPFNEYGTRYWAGDGGQLRQAVERESRRYEKEMAAVLAGLKVADEAP